MWLCDSANQMQSYLLLLTADSSPNSLASLYRGVINLQARYIQTSPHCNSFQPPPESGLPAQDGHLDTVYPPHSNNTVFECKYELDSFAAFLEISTNYYTATQDIDFFRRYSWTAAIETTLNVTQALQIGTYASNGAVNTSPYTFQRQTASGTETLTNTGRGNPMQEGTGLIRSAFRLSDDECIYELFIPANMMFAHYLEASSDIMDSIGGQRNLANHMHNFATSIRAAITQYGIITHPKYGQLYAYEIDGFGSASLMDDANISSLLSAPLVVTWMLLIWYMLRRGILH
jgi:meiotically up-regulated gene 157 (Mug157) protein